MRENRGGVRGKLNAREARSRLVMASSAKMQSENDGVLVVTGFDLPW